MAGNESAAQQEQTETDNVEMDKFQGFSAKDGEVEKAPAAKPEAGTKTPAAKPAAKTTEGEDEGEGEGADGQKHKSADKRISQAVGRQRAAERRAEAAERRASDMEARLARLETGGLTPQTQAGNAAKAPNPKDYEGGEYDVRYLADVAKHEARIAASEAVSTASARTQQAAQSERQQARTAEFQAKRDDFFAQASEKYDDFEDVVGLPVDEGGPPISPVVGDLALESDFGADILYELAGDLKEARKVYGMSPARQAAWFGKREYELSAKSSAADGENGGDGHEDGQSGSRPSKVTKAPAAPDYNARGAGANPKVSAATTDFKAFERMASPQKK